MIAPMEKLVLAGPKGRARELLQSLQGAGVVHLETLRVRELAEYRLSPEEREELRRWEGVAAGAEHTLTLLGLEPEATRPFPEDLEAAERALKPIQAQAEGLQRQKQELEEELSLAQAYLEPLEKLAALAQGLDRSPFFRVVPFVLTAKELPLVEGLLQKTLEDRFLLAAEAYAKGLVALLVVHRGDLEGAKAALSRAGVAELRLPGPLGEVPLSEAVRRLRKRAEAAPKELSEVRQALFRLAGDVASTLRSLWTRAKDEVVRLRALEELASGRFGFALLGYVPVRAKSRVEEALARHKDTVVYAFEPVDEHHEADHVPVVLDNPPWAKPYEFLVAALNLPKYGTLDPTPFVAVLFPFWFGFIMGDIGHALLFALLGLWLGGYVRRGETLRIDLFALRLPPKALAGLLQILWFMVFWSLVFGFVYGKFFGTLGKHLHLFGTKDKPGLLPFPLVDRTDIANTFALLLGFTLVMGGALVLWGFVVRMRLALRHRHLGHFWEALGYAGGVVALLVLLWNILFGVSVAGLMPLVYAGLGLFLAGMVLSRQVLMLPELPTQAGHVVSFARLYAVGVAKAIMVGLFTDVGWNLGQGGVFWALLGFLVAALLHLFILLLTTLGHMLQALRLLWVEYFTKFGFYEENGRPYRPFKSVREAQ
ncbi:V-type ATP synthase subunit I [Thermus thermamylovorans]|uniref:V-type ATP synthase subunit I n=1 Tax=Thermus thermamylovorans TaxID=2509362 RepID=A0A4Q9B7F1_9DEIN|nr:V-type ATPase 116kDa subunit family protein [Thermus thermamylovorans]TBH21042.1 V-type ATP synthase subunit I [Thermus thermamylovorans]